MNSLNFNQKVEICRINDGTYNGDFFLAVKSTQIFCLPSCRAKFPKIENIKFYQSKSQAILQGFRGCKRCRSEFYPHTEPVWIHSVLSSIDGSIFSKLDNKQLEKVANVNISTVKRYFNEYLKTTPAKYLRKKKLELARSKIISGENYKDVCFELGFDSISGFRDAYKKHFNETPGAIN